MLLAEHSPIRLLEYDWSWGEIRQWVTAHLVRHHEGCEKFVHTQRGDRRKILEDYGVETRDELPQGAFTKNKAVLPTGTEKSAKLKIILHR